MSKLGETASYVRSKNAGPFWVTVDIFCGSEAAYEQGARSPNLNARRLAQLLGVRPEGMKLFRLPALRVVKVSYPREQPQGSPGERDMHSGQQYIPLLDMEL